MEVIAALLQDALVPLKEVAYLKADNRFVLVANRFRWEHQRDQPPGAAAAGDDASFTDDSPPPAFERINCGLCFDRVRRVRFQGFDLEERDQILNLLTLRQDRTGVTLAFSGDVTIRLEGPRIACHLEDLGAPWPTDARPTHDEAEPGPAGS